jgi:uracil-DNA glycosylase
MLSSKNNKDFIQLINGNYLWEEMTLWEYLKEGNIPSHWKNFFIENQQTLFNISQNLLLKNTQKIYPPINKVFRAFIPLKKIKVVILGQDPYHNGSAVGYCFSVLSGNSINPSLMNIYKELKNEGYDITKDGNLTHWVNQGCFLLNTALTVEKGCPNSHTSYWNDFTANTVKYVVDNCENIVWLLMGSKAQKFKQFISSSHHTICTSHPSPFSAYKGYRDLPAFIGSGVFLKINDYLTKTSRKPIYW